MGSLVGNLGDDDGGAALADLIDIGGSPHLDRSPTRAQRLLDAARADNVAAGREIRALHEIHEILDGGLGIFEHMDAGVDDFTEVVRWDVGGHSDGNPGGAVHQQIGEAAR